MFIYLQFCGIVNLNFIKCLKTLTAVLIILIKFVIAKKNYRMKSRICRILFLCNAILIHNVFKSPSVNADFKYNKKTKETVLLFCNLIKNKLVVIARICFLQTITDIN